MSAVDRAIEVKRVCEGVTNVGASHGGADGGLLRAISAMQTLEAEGVLLGEQWEAADPGNTIGCDGPGS